MNILEFTSLLFGMSIFAGLLGLAPEALVLSTASAVQLEFARRSSY
jgi:hypothetical protein